MCVGTSPWYRGEHSLWEWPISTQLLVWGALFALRCNPWSGRWDPGGWVMVDIYNPVYCHWQYTILTRNSCRREVRIGPTWSIGWSRQAQEPTTIVLLITAKNKHCFILYVHVALGAVARINWVIPCVLPEYINHVSLAWLSGDYPQQHVPWLMNFHVQNMSKQLIKINSDGTLKRVQKEVSGLSSSDDESTKSEKRSKVTSSNWPRFLIISSTEDWALTKLSPFAVQKATVGLAGEPKSVKKIKIGLLVECVQTVSWYQRLFATYQLR